MPRPRRNVPSSRAANAADSDEQLIKKTKRSLDIDRIKNMIVTDFLHKYMSKREAASFFLIEEDTEPALTESVWEELERQNQEFFRAYKCRVVLKDQIMLFNELLMSQRNAMEENLQNGVSSGSVLNRDPTCSTSAYGSNPTNMQHDTFPSIVGMDCRLSENLRVPAVYNDVGHAPMMETSSRGINGGRTPAYVSNPTNMQHNTFPSTAGMDRPLSENQRIPAVYNGADHAPVMETSSRIMHDGINGSTSTYVSNPTNMQHDTFPSTGAVPNNGAVYIPCMDPSTGILNVMHSPATSLPIYGSSPFQEAIIHPSEVRNQTIFSISDQTFQDVMERYSLSLEESNFSFPLPTQTDMDVDDIFDGDFSERMVNDLQNNFNATQIEAPRVSDYPNNYPG